MGMFFYVKPDIDDKCPFCDEPVKEWQSKSSIEQHSEWGGCCKEHPDPLPTLEKSEVYNFYHLCSKCDKFIKYENTDPYKLRTQTYKLIKK